MSYLASQTPIVAAESSTLGAAGVKQDAKASADAAEFVAKSEPEAELGARKGLSDVKTPQNKSSVMTGAGETAGAAANSGAADISATGAKTAVTSNTRLPPGGPRLSEGSAAIKPLESVTSLPEDAMCYLVYPPNEDIVWKGAYRDIAAAHKLGKITVDATGRAERVFGDAL